jgi:hypothetical protein
MSTVSTKTVAIVVEPEGKSISAIPWTEGMNVQQAMERAYELPPGLSFALEYYGSKQGYKVIMVDGVADQSNHFWFLYINGALSQAGIDTTQLNPSDVVTLTYQS